MMTQSCTQSVSGSLPKTRQPLLTFSLLVLGLALLGAGYAGQRQPLVKVSDSLVMRCEHLSGQVGLKLLDHGVVADSPEFRRQKQHAFGACLDDYDAFTRLVAAE
jgi:hypothetical protein